MIYNHKSEDIIQDIVTENIYPIIDDIKEEYMRLRRDETLNVYVPGDIAREILSELLENLDDVFVHSESDNQLLYNDKNNVLITLAYDGMIFVEDAYYENDLKPANAEMNYIHDSFSFKEVKRFASDGYPILVFGTNDVTDEDDEYEIDCCDRIGNGVCEKSDDKTIYKVNGKSATKEEYFKAVQKFDEEFMDILHDGLIQHRRVMDSFNDFLSAFRW